MKKKLYLSLIIILFIGCKKNIQIDEVNINDIAELKDNYKMDNNEYLHSLLEIKQVNDSLIYCTDLNLSALFKIDIKNKFITKVSKKGKGPGEQIKPFSFDYKNDTLYVNDARDNRIHKYDVSGKWISQSRYNDLFYIGHKMAVSDEIIYFLNDGAGGYRSYICNTNGEYIGEIPSYISSIGYATIPATICIKDNIIYYTNPYENNIKSYNIKTKKEEVYDLSVLDPKYNLSVYEGKTIPKNNQMKIIYHERDIDLRKFQIINEKNDITFLISVGNKKLKSFDHYIYDLNDKRISKIKGLENKICISHKNTLVTIDFIEKNEKIVINNYILKD